MVTISPGIVTTLDALAEKAGGYRSGSVGLDAHLGTSYHRYEQHKYCDCGALVWDLPEHRPLPVYGRRITCLNCGADHTRTIERTNSYTEVAKATI